MTPDAHSRAARPSGEGYRVRGVESGDEMWDTLANAAVDLIILDVMLPAVSGIELCRAPCRADMAKAMRVKRLCGRRRSSCFLPVAGRGIACSVSKSVRMIMCQALQPEGVAGARQGGVTAWPGADGA